MSEFRMTGRKALAIFIGAFGLIISVNLFMAYSAVSTFPGLEVRNSYVASQGFNDRLLQQRALGWQVRAELQADELVLHFTDPEGEPVVLASLEGILGRPTHTREDRSPQFEGVAGTYAAPVHVTTGQWLLHLTATAPDGTLFRQRLNMYLPG